MKQLKKLISFIILGLMALSGCSNWSDPSVNGSTDISINGFSRESDTFSLKVDNDVESFSFIEKVTIDSSSSWKLYSDIAGTQEIVTKTISLDIGDNFSYILVTSNTGELGFYTVNVRRLKLCTVQFNTHGGTTIPQQNIQEESLASRPEINPERYGYSFEDWDFNFEEPIMNDVIIDSIWNIKNFDVEFVNWDGTLLYTTNVEYLKEAVYEGPEPTRVSDKVGYHYVFKGWDGSLTRITKDTIFTAQYDCNLNFYEVNFLNWDGSLLQTVSVPHSGEAIYTRELPTKEENDDYRYEFIGWDKTLSCVEKSFDTTALFSEIKKHTVRFFNYDGTLLYSCKVSDGDTAVYQGTIPTKPDTNDDSFTFLRWDKSLENIKSDSDFKAIYGYNYSMVYNKNNFTKEGSYNSVYYRQKTFTGWLYNKSKNINDYVSDETSPKVSFEAVARYNDLGFILRSGSTVTPFNDSLGFITTIDFHSNFSGWYDATNLLTVTSEGKKCSYKVNSYNGSSATDVSFIVNNTNFEIMSKNNNQVTTYSLTFNFVLETPLI